MKMAELIRYDIPAEIIPLWQKEESNHLLPVQEMAIKRYKLFGNENLLIQAPTSSGKTFIGEMAALHTALRRKKVVYLVPLKALAEEKFHDFKRKYDAYGIKVIIATRDHREYDEALERGDFSIAIVVYEKLAQLLVRHPERITEIELAIADELEILSDPERGAMAELLLTRLLYPSKNNDTGPPRLIGLSAVIGGAEKLAAWMHASLLYYERRPIELRYGVLHNGRFQYRTYNEQNENEETLLEIDHESPWEILSHTARYLAEQNETCLIFVKSKHESRRTAEHLATQLDLPAAQNTLEELRTLEPTRCRNSLLHSLNTGVAFHNADLSPEERHIIEQGFRNREIRLLVCTSTLAVGINLPAQNVFISTDKWCYDRHLDLPWKSPILHTEYENMSGRAGRFGAGHAFGRAILIAVSPFDQETLWRRYVEGEREAIAPRLGKEPLEDHILHLVAARLCQNLNDLTLFLENTLTGQWIWIETYTRDEISNRIQKALHHCIDLGLLTDTHDDVLAPTPLGHTVAAKGIRIETACALMHWIGESENRRWTTPDLLFATATTLDGRTPQVLLTTREYEQERYPKKLMQYAHEIAPQVDVPLSHLRDSPRQLAFEEVRSIKTTLLLHDWLKHTSIPSIEEKYNTMSGQIISSAEQISWLIDATAAIAVALGCETAFCETLQKLATRTQYGIQEELLPLLRINQETPLSRKTLIALFDDDLHHPQVLVRSPKHILNKYLPEQTASALQQWAQQQVNDISSVSPKKNIPILIIDDAHPGQILLDDVTISLQEKQFRLIKTLAMQPNQCIPYDTIYTAVWGASIVENNQLHFQKRKLLQRIEKNTPQYAKLITTIPKRGFMLALPPEKVAVNTNTRPAKVVQRPQARGMVLTIPDHSKKLRSV